MVQVKDVTIKYVDEDLKTLRTVSSGRPVGYLDSFSYGEVPIDFGYNDYRVNDRPVRVEEYDKVVDYLTHGGIGELWVDYGDCQVCYVDSVARQVENINGGEIYFNASGELHREDGPAYLNGKTSRYYWKGQRISKKDHQIRAQEKIMKIIIKKKALEFDGNYKQLIYRDNGLYFHWKVPERKLEVVKEFVKNQTGKRFFELTNISGKKEVVHFENGQIVSRTLEAPTREKTYKYSNNKLVEFTFNGEHADISCKKLSRGLEHNLEYKSDTLSFLWDIPQEELPKISNWIIDDLQGELTFSNGYEDVLFKDGELVKRVVGPERFLYEYKEGRRLVESKEEAMSEKKNLLDMCRDYSFLAEYFGVTDYSPIQQNYFDGGWHSFKNGILHNEYGPAVVTSNSIPQYFLGGQQLAKEEWLCLTDPEYSGNISLGILHDEVRFYKEGKLHREFGPAVMNQNGSQQWYREGKLHRENGPATITDKGMKWAINGELFDNCEWAEAKDRYLQLQKRVSKKVTSPHVKRTRGLGEKYEAFLVVNHAEDDDYSWIVSSSFNDTKKSFFIDLQDLDVPDEISKSSEFGEALLDAFIAEGWRQNWYYISNDEKLNKIAKKYLEAAEAKVKENLKGVESLSKDKDEVLKLLKKQEIEIKDTVPFVKLSEEEMEEYAQPESKDRFMYGIAEDKKVIETIEKAYKKVQKKVVDVNKPLGKEAFDELELVNDILNQIDECYDDENKIDPLLMKIRPPFLENIKSVKNQTLIINAVAGLANHLMEKDRKTLRKEIKENMIKEPMIPESILIARKDDDWVKKESKEMYSATYNPDYLNLILPEETKKDKAKKSLGVVKDATKQGIRIGVATEGANIAYDSVKNMLVNVLGISPKALESKVNQELIMMTALAMTHLAAEIYSDKVNSEKIQELCGLVMEGKVKDNTGTIIKMVPMLMNVSKKMDVESKLRFDTPEVVAQEALPEELMEALNEAEEMEEEYARVRD